MDSNAKKTYFDLLKTEYQRCLEPTERCSAPPIRAHSIQNSKVLDQLCHEGHVIMPRLSHKPDGRPHVTFDRIGRRKASTFTGLCSGHDAEIFRPIETDKLDFSDPVHLFLIAYRAVLKESHACFEAACKHQSGYQARVESGKSPGDRPDQADLLATGWLCNAYDTYLYKKKYDQAFLVKDYNRLVHHYIRIDDCSPSIATSALFSLDDCGRPDDVARVALSIFPLGDATHVLFSFLTEEERFAKAYLQRIFDGEGYYQRYLLSKVVLQHCENFTISPVYYEKMSDAKRQALVGFFCDTLSESRRDYEDEQLYLF